MTLHGYWLNHEGKRVHITTSKPLNEREQRELVEDMESYLAMRKARIEREKAVNNNEPK